ncbi:glycosyltransferase family 2 protein [Turicibacter sanguinis]|uniref:glycosyltransferase family 2 protein n=1 Tax=Turicibacter sanguinis TaxID=154288 RepID=UPI0018AC1479|nr:glycosyltransferase [Turicibacter sanguinis]MDB8558257.1 glycosyltransferase [Turicibacter sanguinis]
MAKHAFVILHYNNYLDTIECIDSIINNINHKNYHIVVVDNQSPNNSGKILLSKYFNHNKVTVILSDKNLGFAKGNNLGFEYAKKKLNSDFIILINNDTEIHQEDFLKKIEKKYEMHSFAVLGPDIITLDNIHQNPQKLIGYNMKAIVFQIIRYCTLLVLNILNLEHTIRKFISNKKYEKDVSLIEWNKEQINVQLHGSCLIFSGEYIKLFDGLYDGTFMYLEEDILFYLCKKFNLKTVYSPEVQITHKEDLSTNG